MLIVLLLFIHKYKIHNHKNVYINYIITNQKLNKCFIYYQMLLYKTNKL